MGARTAVEEQIQEHTAGKRTTDRVAANKQTVDDYVKAFNAGNFERLRGLFTPDAQIFGVVGWGDVEAAEPVWRQLHDGLAATLQVEEVAVDGETVVVRYTERGKFIGAFMGHAPTGRPFECLAMEWYTMKDGRIHRKWGVRDSLRIARQIGLALQ